MTATALPIVTAIVDFNNADETDRPAMLRFDLGDMPSTMRLSVRLTAGVVPYATSGVIARAPTSEDSAPPPGFGTEVYDIDGGTVAELAANLRAFEKITAYLALRSSKPQPPGGRYTFDVLQYTRSAQTKQNDGYVLRGGSTFVVPIAGDLPASSPPPPDDDQEERIQPATYPWLRAVVDERFTQVFRHRMRGPHATSVVVTNDRAEYAGPAPVTVTFTATVTTEGPPGAICYTWLRSDGAIGPVNNLAVPGPGFYTLTTVWQLGEPGTQYEGWQALRIFGDDVVTSAKSVFAAELTS